MTFFQDYINTINLEQLLLTLSTKTLATLALLIGYTFIKKLAHRIFKKTIAKSVNFSIQSHSRQETLVKLSQNIMDYSLGFVTLYWTLSVWGLPIASLLAGAGIAGIAIGLGAQGFLTDLVNGFFILFERQFDVGDTIQVNAIKGSVTSLGLRTTQIRSTDGSLYFIPNRNITMVGNLSRNNMKVQIDLPLPFGSDLEAVSQVVQEVNQKHTAKYPEIISSPVILGPVTTLSGHFAFRIEITTTNGQQSTISYAFYGLYQDALRQAGLLKK